MSAENGKLLSWGGVPGGVEQQPVLLLRSVHVKPIPSHCRALSQCGITEAVRTLRHILRQRGQPYPPRCRALLRGDGGSTCLNVLVSCALQFSVMPLSCEPIRRGKAVHY
ncbi:hypothetical protein M513_06228 [Trichuris suis]|uniref:Uncharacterized protein n=1 Tax=Trichuris suis TaxID=68888 RepID=A0A085M6S2_9BILA|nr:hypothetical protein M513_06228 [Trichuris suis]